MQTRMAYGTNFYRTIPPSVLSAIFPGEARWLRPYCTGGKPDKNAIAMAMRYLKEADPLYYNSLVDKHTKGYRNKPTIKSHLHKYGYLAEDGKVYPTRREQLEANKVFRVVREREAMVTQLEIKEKARLERLKRAARAGTIAFTSEGIFETKACSICPSVYHKVPSITDPKDPCPGSCLNTTNSSHSRLTTDRSSMTITQPKEDVGVQCWQSPVCGRCEQRPVAEPPPPIALTKSSGRADVPFKQGGFPHRDASSKTRLKDDGTEAVNMQKAKYQAMLDEEEQTLRRMIETERQKLYKAQKEAELAEKATFQRKAMLKKELEDEKERNILERKHKVALGAILTECQKRAESHVTIYESVEKEINEMKMKFEDAMRHNRILHLKPSKSALHKTMPPQVEVQADSTIPQGKADSTIPHGKADSTIPQGKADTTTSPGKVNTTTFSSASSGSLDPNLAAISPERSGESLVSASSKGSSKVTSSYVLSIIEHTNKMATSAMKKTAPSKPSQATSPSHSECTSSRCDRGTNTSPPPLPPVDPHPRKYTRVLHRELDPTLLPHVPQSMEITPDHTHPMEEQTTLKPSVESPIPPGTVGGSSSPLTQRGKTATQRERQGKSRKPPIASVADGHDGHDISTRFKLPSVVAPHLSELSQLPVPCNSMASAASHATRVATSCPVDMHRKAEGSEPTKPPALWNSLPAIVTASSTAKELTLTLDGAVPKGQSQILESEEAGGFQPTVTNESKFATETACMDKKRVIFEAQGDQPMECQQQDSSQGMDSVGVSVSLPHKLQHETKEAVRPPRSSLPTSMPSRNSKEKVTTQHRVRQRRASPSTTDTSTSTDEENACGKHVAFKPQGDGIHPALVGGSSSVPTRLHQRPKEVLSRPLRCSLPATLERSSDEEDTALPSTEYGSTELSV